jgi:hypothetical protein
VKNRIYHLNKLDWNNALEVLIEAAHRLRNDAGRHGHQPAVTPVAPVGGTATEGTAEGAMTDGNYWQDLEARFRALSQSALGLRADWHYVSGARGNWQIAGSAPESRLRFENLARRAGTAISEPAQVDSLQAWLDLVRKRGINFKLDDNTPWSEQNADGTEGPSHVSGTISNVCEASANLCLMLENDALAAGGGKAGRSSRPPEAGDSDLSKPAAQEDQSSGEAGRDVPELHPKHELRRTEIGSDMASSVLASPQVERSAKKRGRRADPGRRNAIRTAILKHGEAWRDHLGEIFTELDSQKAVPLRDFQGMKIDLGDGASIKTSKWEDLDLAQGAQRRQIVDMLRKYAD